MPRRARNINIQWPMGGMNERWAYQSQPPFTTPLCQNVRPRDTKQSRLRGGSRPGLIKWFRRQQLGNSGGDPIRMMEYVTINRDDGFRFWIDQFDRDVLGSVWAKAAWLTGAPDFLPDDLDDIVYTVEERGIVRSALDIDLTQSYSIDLFINPYQDEHHGTYKIYARMNNSTPDATNEGIIAEITLLGTSGAYSGKLTEYNGGTPTEYTFSSGTLSQVSPGIFTVTINGDNVKCYWEGVELVDQNVTSHTGERLGFGMICTNNGGICLTDATRVQYYESNVVTKDQTMMVVSAGGKLYYEGIYGSFIELSSNLNLTADYPIEAVQRGQKLYIADYGPAITEQTDGVIASDDQLTSVSVADFTALDFDQYSYVVVLYNASSSLTAGVYTISSIASGAITLAASPGASGTCSFRIERGPKIFDPKELTLTLWTATEGKGFVPAGRPLIGVYRDCLILGGAKESPAEWDMSRQADPHDWDFSEDDASAAVAGINSIAGIPPEPLKAIIPHKDDYCVFGCTNSLYVLRGHPRFGGQIDPTSLEIGIVAGNAWCKTPDDEIVFLSREGVYYLPPGATQVVPISRDELPRRLLSQDNGEPIINMEYDLREKGVHLYISLGDDRLGGDWRTGNHWWLDWTFKNLTGPEEDRLSAWPVHLDANHDPTALIRLDSEIAIESGVYLGCRDGYIRRYSEGMKTDDGIEIDSYVYFGPIRISGNDFEEGIVEKFIATLGETSDDVTWELYTADYPEQLLLSSAKASGTWSKRINPANRPCRRGVNLLLKVSGTSSWVYENVIAQLRSVGEYRE